MKQVKTLEEIVDILNEYWSNLKKFPKLSDFNSIVEINKDSLNILENKYNTFITNNENLTVISILASITRMLTGKTIAAIIENSDKDMTPEQFEQAKREIAVKWCPWSEKTSFKRNGKDYVPFDQMVSDLTALLEQHKEMIIADMYPKEFIEWIGDDCSPCYLERKEDGYGKWIVFKKGSMEHEAEFDTLAELFDYWLKNGKQ